MILRFDLFFELLEQSVSSDYFDPRWMSSTFAVREIDHIYQDPHLPGAKLFLHYGDLSVSGQITELRAELKEQRAKLEAERQALLQTEAEAKKEAPKAVVKTID